MHDLFANMKWDWWEAFGLVGEALFFVRLIVQMRASEIHKRPVLPAAYWYMSLAGCSIVAVYALHKGSFVVLLPQLVFPLYLRNLQLELSYRRREAARREAGFDQPGYSWPRLSVIVPVHNEAKVLASTLERLLGQDYPGPRPEIIAALNGCTDASWAIAQGFGVKVVESEHCGMSFGKNLGARAASGDLLVFVDADTVLPHDALRLCAEAFHGKAAAVGTVPGKPDRGGLVVRGAFWIANRRTRRKLMHAPGGVMVMHRAVWSGVNGFDEALPQGTSSDLILRARAAGAEYVFIDSFAAVTSVRRFEKTGVVRQMLDWRCNHKALEAGHRQQVAAKEYDNVR